jgi:DNA-binding transcriptional LysR family regulator
VDTLDEEWISLTAGAAMLQKQQEAALAANRPLRLRMQVRSFDAVCHMVASGLGWPSCRARPASPCCAA